MTKKKKKKPPTQAAGWRARMTPEPPRGQPGGSGSQTGPQTRPGSGDGDPGDRPVSGFRAPAGTRAPGLAPAGGDRDGSPSLPSGAADADLDADDADLAPDVLDAEDGGEGTALTRSGPPRESRVRPGRTPAGRTSAREPRPGGLFGLRVPSPYPKLGPTLVRGLAAVAGSPFTLLGPPLVALLIWAGLLAAGIDHMPSYFHDVLALPPISTNFFDFGISLTVGGLSFRTLALMMGLTVVRALVMAVLIGLLLEALEHGRVSFAGMRRGLRAIFPMFGLMLMFLSLMFFSRFVAQFIGSFGTLVFFGALIGGAFLLGFAPIVAVRDGVSPREAMARSFRASRIPGGRHLMMMFLYFALTIVSFVQPGNSFTVNPSFRYWAYVLAMTVVHMVFLAGLAYRYDVIEDEIPPPRPRGARRPVTRR